MLENLFYTQAQRTVAALLSLYEKAHIYTHLPQPPVRSGMCATPACMTTLFPCLRSMETYLCASHLYSESAICILC